MQLAYGEQHLDTIACPLGHPGWRDTAGADTSSTQVGSLITDLRFSSTFAPGPSPAQGPGGIMVCRAAAPGLPRRDQRPSIPTPPADERQRKGHRDPRTPAPTAGPTASGRQADPHRQRPCHPRQPAPPPPQRQTAAPSAAGPPRHGVALASRPAQAAPCRILRTQATRTPTHHPIDTPPGPAPGQGEHLMGIPTDPRRTHSAGNQDRRLHGLGVSMAVECWSRTMG